jgi:radical SAM superfamily enzyme YgiQ (UPF0313 family)
MRTDILFTRNYLLPEEEYGIFADAGSTEVPNGLCWLAAVTREKGYNTSILDAHVLKFSNRKAASIILRKNPKYLGISADTINIFHAADLARRVKIGNPDIKIILGGPHLVAAPEETMNRFYAFDIGVLGEGELTIIELLKRLENGEGLETVKGLIYRSGDKLETTEKREFIKDLDTLPLPAWDLLPDMRKFYQPPLHGMHRGRSTLLITSRGCPNQCTFCDRAVFGNYCRAHSADYVMKMIHELYYKYGIRHLRINDDNFLMFKDRLKAICEKILNEGLKITWSCFARVDSVNPEMLRMIKRAGCWQVSFGIESGEQRILDEEKKGISLAKIAEAVKMARIAKLKVVGFNIVGHPLETEKSIQKTIDFNKKIKVDDFYLQFMTPFPGTELYDNIEKYGEFDKDWRKMGVFKEPCFIPYGLTKEVLIKYQKKAFWQFYLQPRVIISYLRALKSFSDFFNFFKTGFGVALSLIIKRKKNEK